MVRWHVRPLHAVKVILILIVIVLVIMAWLRRVGRSRGVVVVWVMGV